MPPSTPISQFPLAGRRSRWPKRLLFVLTALVVLVVAAFFVLTSQAFLKAFVLPQVSAALNAKVTAGEIHLSPFSQLRLNQLRIETSGDTPLLRAEEARVRYALFSLIRGKVVVPEISLVRPEIYLETAASGSSNFDPLLSGLSSEPSPPRKEPLQLDLGTVSVRSGSFTYCLQDASGARSCTSISNLDLSITGVRNGAAGKATLSAAVLLANQVPTNRLEQSRGQLQGEFDFTLQADLLPKALKGSLTLAFQQAEGALKDLQGWSARLNTEIEPGQIRQLALQFQRAGQPAGEASVNGPYDLTRNTGRLNVRLASVGRTALSLVGAPLGLDFGETTIEGSGYCDVVAGNQFTVSATAAARQFSVKQGNLVTPPLDLQLELRGNTALIEKTAYIEKLALTSSQSGRELLSLATERAINLAWGRQESRQSGDALIRCNLQGLDLSEWRALIGTNVVGGVVGLQANVVVGPDGRKIVAAFSNQVDGLKLALPTGPVEGIHTRFSGSLIVTDFRILGLERGLFSYAEATTNLLNATLSASLDPQNTSGNLQVTASGELPVLLARHPLPNLAFERGNLRLSSLVNWSRGQYSGNFSLLAGDISGTVGGYRVDGYSAQFDADGELNRDKCLIRRLGLSAREGPRSGGTIDFSGQLDGANQNAHFSLNASGLNQSALRPILASAWPSHDLATAELDAAGSIRYDARQLPPNNLDGAERLQLLLDQMRVGAGETALQMRADATNLIVRSRATQRTNAPVGVSVVFEATRRGEVYELGTNRIQLAKTDRANNQVLVTGRLDMTPTNARPSTLSVQAQALDLTPLLDFLEVLDAVGTSAPTPARAAASTAPAPASAPVETEPPPVDLPLKQLTADLKVVALYAREIQIRDWIAKLVLDQGRLTLAPFDLKFNDAPVSASAKVDLTRPGYEYDLAFKVAALPLAPIVNSTAPDYLDAVRGDAAVSLQLAGAGITGPSLQKHLRGEASLVSTNLSFQIVTPRLKRILTALAAALRLDDLAKSPLTILSAQMKVGDGRVAIQPLRAGSDAFMAQAEGVIQLAAVLTNSTLDLPVQLALRQDLARQINLGNLPPAANTNFLVLPPLVRLAGTVGAPETEIDKVRLAALLAGSLGGALGGQTGTALQGVGGLLQGDTKGALGALDSLLQGQKRTTTTNPPPPGVVTNSSGARSGATNPPPAASPTNAPPKSTVQGLLDTLRKKE